MLTKLLWRWFLSSYALSSEWKFWSCLQICRIITLKFRNKIWKEKGKNPALFLYICLTYATIEIATSFHGCCCIGLCITAIHWQQLLFSVKCIPSNLFPKWSHGHEIRNHVCIATICRQMWWLLLLLLNMPWRRCNLLFDCCCVGEADNIVIPWHQCPGTICFWSVQWQAPAYWRSFIR